MAIEIKQVTTNRELKAFVQFPYNHFKGNAYFVPPLFFEEFNNLHWKKNPAFEYCEAAYFLAKKNGKVVGRIACIINRKVQEKTGKAMARFNWVDFVEDKNVSRLLFEAAENWAKEKGMTHIQGPAGFTNFDPAAMLVKGFDQPITVAGIYNYPYYPEHLEKLGYETEEDWVEYEIQVPKAVPGKVIRLADMIEKRYKVRQAKINGKTDMMKYASGVFDVIAEAYEELYEFVPLSKSQIEKYTKKYFGFLRPDFLSIIVDENDRVVAFGIAMPSVTKALQKAKGKLFPLGWWHLRSAMKKNNRGELMLIGVLPEYQKKGIIAICFKNIMQAFIDAGIESVETNPELVSNKKVQLLWSNYEWRKHKWRKSYVKKISDSDIAI